MGREVPPRRARRGTASPRKGQHPLLQVRRPRPHCSKVCNTGADRRGEQRQRQSCGQRKSRERKRRTDRLLQLLRQARTRPQHLLEQAERRASRRARSQRRASLCRKEVLNQEHQQRSHHRPHRGARLTSSTSLRVLRGKIRRRPRISVAECRKTM